VQECLQRPARRSHRQSCPLRLQPRQGRLPVLHVSELILRDFVFVFLVSRLSWAAISTSGSVGDNCTTPADENGECRSLKNCPALLELVRETESASLLNESRCGFDGLDPLVCCPDLSHRRPAWNNNPDRNRDRTTRRPTTSSQGGGSGG